MALFVGGCVSDMMNDGLADLKGKDVHVAMNRLGPPNGQWNLMGETVYVWHAPGRAPAQFMDTGNGPAVPGPSGCSIQISANAASLVQEAQWSGSHEACSSYANALWTASLGLPTP